MNRRQCLSQCSRVVPKSNAVGSGIDRCQESIPWSCMYSAWVKKTFRLVLGHERARRKVLWTRRSRRLVFQRKTHKGVVFKIFFFWWGHWPGYWNAIKGLIFLFVVVVGEGAGIASDTFSAYCSLHSSQALDDSFAADLFRLPLPDWWFSIAM